MIDVAVGSVVVSGIGALVEPVSATVGEVVQALGFPVAIACAVAGFVRTTRGSVRTDDPRPGRPPAGP